MATVVAELSAELITLGHEVTVAARIDGSALHETGAGFASLGRVPWPVSVYARLRWKIESGLNRAFGWPWPAYASYLGALWWRLRRSPGTPDVIVVHNDPFVVRYLRRWAPHATVVLWLHNEPHNLPRRRRATDRVDLVVTVSDFLAGRAAALLGIDPRELVTIHNGVNQVAFHPRPGFEEPSKPLRVLCLGRLDRNKGADIALAAVSQLAGAGVEIQLDVVGSAWFSATPGLPKDPWTEDLVSELAAAGAVHTPHVPRAKSPPSSVHTTLSVFSRVGTIPFPWSFSKLWLRVALLWRHQGGEFRKQQVARPYSCHPMTQTRWRRTSGCGQASQPLSRSEADLRRPSGGCNLGKVCSPICSTHSR